MNLNKKGAVKKQHQESRDSLDMVSLGFWILKNENTNGMACDSAVSGHRKSNVVQTRNVGEIGLMFNGFVLCRGVCRQFFQMVFMQVKSAGNHRNFKQQPLNSSSSRSGIGSVPLNRAERAF